MTLNHRVLFKKELMEICTLGIGATGETKLFEDEFTGIKFAIKKFSPHNEDKVDEYFNRFISEIKLLSEIVHPNIVRFYEFYLYPEVKTGFIKMEYVEGSKICDFDIRNTGRTWDSIFIDLIDAFEYLEKSNILHRDIRFDNILVNTNGIPKVIDFGFGKKIIQVPNETSTIIQTPFSEEPEEVMTRFEYNHKTELFFLGKMFQNLGLLDQPDFSFKPVVHRMIQYYEDKRFQSFREIKDIINLKLIEPVFTSDQKRIYLLFADSLTESLIEHEDNIVVVENHNTIIRNLYDLILKSLLEDELQKSSDLIYCFVDNNYTFKRTKIKMEIIKNFYEMLVSVNDYQKQIIIENIMARIRSKPIGYSMPF